MTIRRYRRAPIIKNGSTVGTGRSGYMIFKAAERGRVETNEYISREGDRLDTLAGKFYGNGTLWWIIAAASGVGWFLQVPPGTVLRIPTKLGQIDELVG
jgi:nucleoid-associated protein YgaU